MESKKITSKKLKKRIIKAIIIIIITTISNIAFDSENSGSNDLQNFESILVSCLIIISLIVIIKSIMDLRELKICNDDLKIENRNKSIIAQVIKMVLGLGVIIMLFYVEKSIHFGTIEYKIANFDLIKLQVLGIIAIITMIIMIAGPIDIYDNYITGVKQKVFKEGTVYSTNYDCDKMNLNDFVVEYTYDFDDIRDIEKCCKISPLFGLFGMINKRCALWSVVTIAIVALVIFLFILWLTHYSVKHKLVVKDNELTYYEFSKKISFTFNDIKSAKLIIHQGKLTGYKIVIITNQNDKIIINNSSLEFDLLKKRLEMELGEDIFSKIYRPIEYYLSE